jgi:ribulose-phosphate 3-epimerase
MKSKFMVAPSILSGDFANLEKEVHAITKAGADWLHVDVMDGHFVPNLTIGPPVIKALKRISKIPLDCHLMIEKPEDSIDEYLEAGADHLTIHVEATRDPRALLQKIRAHGCKAGITLRPATPVSEILPYLEDVDLILVMTVNPGFSGQKFMTDAAAKVSEIRAALKARGLQAWIEVDGGINPETAKQCLNADVLVAGNAVFKTPDYAQAIQALKDAK